MLLRGGKCRNRGSTHDGGDGSKTASDHFELIVHVVTVKSMRNDKAASSARSMSIMSASNQGCDVLDP